MWNAQWYLVCHRCPTNMKPLSLVVFEVKREESVSVCVWEGVLETSHKKHLLRKRECHQ